MLLATHSQSSNICSSQAREESWRETKVLGDTGSTPCFVLKSQQEELNEHQNHCLRPSVVSQRLDKMPRRQLSCANTNSLLG